MDNQIESKNITGNEQEESIDLSEALKLADSIDINVDSEQLSKVETGKTVASTEEEEEQEPVVFPPAQFSFVISTDKMTAYMRVKVFHKDQRVTKQEILEAIEKKEITYGIDDAEIDNFISEGNMLRELRAASGKRPEKGENGSVEIHFDLGGSGRPKENEDGTVDFKDLEIVHNVFTGDLLCTIYPPKEGIDGIDIYGNVVKAKLGDMPVIPTGDKVILSGDGLQVLANTNGNLHFRNNIISIDEVFTVDEVGVETGNIDFNGSVVVNGMIHEGFSVKAAADITVKGMVEGSTIHAGGDILIKLGINGMNKADIFASGDITSGFIESANIKCGGNLFADTILNSKVKAGETVTLRGKRGALLGGTCIAGEAINVKTFGSDKNIQQEVIISPRWYEYEKRGYDEPLEDVSFAVEQLNIKRAKLDEQAKRISAEILKSQRQMREYEKPEEPGDKNARLGELIKAKSQFTRAISAIDKEINDLKTLYEGHDFKVVCIGDCFPGTRIQIGKQIYRVTDTAVQNQTFRTDGGEIVLNTVLPSDRG